MWTMRTMTRGVTVRKRLVYISMLTTIRTTRTCAAFLLGHLQRLQGEQHHVPPQPPQQQPLMFSRSTAKMPLFPIPSPVMTIQYNSFSSSSSSSANKKSKKKKKNNKPKKQRKLSSKEKRRRESEKQKRHNQYKEEKRKVARLKNLHPAAKMKRILSATDYAYSEGNLWNDEFLLDELRAFDGHVRLTTLASFPKLRDWVDMMPGTSDGGNGGNGNGESNNIMMQTFQSLEAQRRYALVCNRPFVEAALRNQQRAESRLAIQEKEAEKERKAQARAEKLRRRARRKELNAYIEKTREEYFSPLWLQLKREWAEEDEKERQQEEEEELRANKSTTTTTERLADFVQTAWTAASTTINPSKDEKKDEDDDDNDDEDPKWDMYWDGGYEESLMEENEQFQEAIYELDEMDYAAEAEWQNLRWERRMGREFPSYDERKSKTKQQGQKQMYGHIKIEKDDSLQDEELPHPVVDDGSGSVVYALVRHKRRSLESLLRERDEIISGYDDDDGDDDDLDEYGIMDDDFFTEHTTWNEYDDEEEEEEEEESTKQKHPKRSSLPKYKSERTVQVIKKPGQLLSFCRDLRKSLQRSKHLAVGFDVEYCTLEMDIRGTLPAMLQLASPEGDGPVGLIWLDKFKNHGRDVIRARHEEEAYAELLSILEDSEISKVGSGVSKDARHLADWWGINDPDFVHYYFTGMFDLEDELLDYEEGSIAVAAKSLQDMCASILQKDLPKLKEKNSKRKKEKRKQGRRVKTSHWRRDDLTEEMKTYAANDVSSSIDVWLKLQTQGQEA